MEFLKNGYKVIYKVTENKEGYLRAAKGLVHGELDQNLVYVNEAGEELTKEDIKAIKLIYSKPVVDEEGNQYIGIFYTNEYVPSEEDHELSAFCGEELVFGAGEPVEKFEVVIAKIANCVIEGAGKYPEGAEVKVTLKPASGYKFGTGNAPTINGEAMELEGNAYISVFEMPAEAVNIQIEGVVVEEKPIAKDAYYYVGEEKVSAINEAWTNENITKGNSLIHNFGPTAAKSYYGVAIKQSFGKFIKAFMNDVEGQDVLNSYDAPVSVQYNGENYFLYMTTENNIKAEEGDKYEFFWK